MTKELKSLLILFVLILLLPNIRYTSEKNQLKIIQTDLSSRIAENVLYNTTLTVTAPLGYSMLESTPIILNLSLLASALPPSVDPFGLDTPDSSDDIKWNAAFVTYEDSLIPSQVDDVDTIPGYSEKDELLFALPDSVNLASGESSSFSIYFSQKDLNLPPPYFPEVCSITPYSKLEEIDDLWPELIDPDDGAYYIGNEIVQGAVLRSAAWSSGAIYELSLLDDQGESRFDIIKEKFPFPSEIWKWSRFARIEEFTSQNQYATHPYPGKLINLIPGPIRARITVQSTQPYTFNKYGEPGDQLDIYGVYTYSVYANQTYFDYSIDITGSEANTSSVLPLEYQNREWGGGRPGTYYKGIYVPGYTEDEGYGEGWVMRAPEDIDMHSIDTSDFSSPWYLEALLEGTTITPSSWEQPDDDKLGYGFIFEDRGFNNISWSASTEGVKNLYHGAQFPLKTRYHPFDADVLGGQDKIAFMEDRYDEFIKPRPTLTFSSSIISVAELPFDSLLISTPKASLDFDNHLLDVENITAFATDVAEFVSDANATKAAYQLLHFDNNSETGITGNLSWNNISQTWEVENIDVSSLNLHNSFVVVVEMETSTLSAKSPPSDCISVGEDIYPPTITAIVQNPSENIRYTDPVEITCQVSDESGISKVILRYHNDSWIDVPMVLEAGKFIGSIPPHSGGTMIEYEIKALDNSDRENSVSTVTFNYTVETDVESSTTRSSVPTSTVDTKISSGFTFIGVLILICVGLSWKKRR